LLVPVTTALSGVDWPAVSEVEVGLSDTDTVGTKAIVALADLLGSTTLFAVSVIVWALPIVTGAV
jgi:hypothetical protein